MDDPSFSTLLGLLGTLSPAQRETLQQLLSRGAPSPIDLLDGQHAAQLQCAHCGGRDVGRWGQAHGLPRYRCRGCSHTFNALTGTPLARLRYKSRWLGFAAALQQAASVRKAARACGVAKSTAFRWRHRFLGMPAVDKPAQLGDIVEADETFFRRSFKGLRGWGRPGWTPKPGSVPPPERAPRHRGKPTAKRGTDLKEQVPVLIMRDRQRVTSDAVLDGLSAKHIGAHLIPLLSPEAMLCTDTGAAYAVVAREARVRHEPINVSAEGYVRDSVFHIQNVNAYDSRLKAWMAPFNGVATKYLHNYLGWRRLIERLGHNINPNAILLSCAHR